MSYVKKEDEYVATPVEKSSLYEKIALATGYCSTAIFGVIFYIHKDLPRTIPQASWRSDLTGEVVHAGSQANMDFWVPAVLFSLFAIFTICVKVRIWWKHY